MLSTQGSKFLSMTEQPPTPPRDISKAVDDALTFLDDGNEVDNLTTATIPTTATIRKLSNASLGPTPSSSLDTANIASGSRRVDFSPHPRYHSIAAVGQVSSPSAQLLKRSPSSRDAKPRKSILKQSHAPPPTPDDLETNLSYFSPTIPGSFNKMLQSALQQLAGPSRSSRLDSYQALNGSLRVYENPPELSTLQQKIGPLMQFLARDLAWKDMDGKLDQPMIHQAQHLTYAILARPSLSGALDDDFRAFLVDRSIAVLEQQDMPKQIFKQHVHLMATQRFTSSVMTSGRADRLVTALRTIEDRCKSQGVLTSRLMAYSRLLEQAPGVMLKRIPDWLDHVFHGMLSSIIEMRQRAIETCSKGGMCLGTQPQAAMALEDLFRKDDEEGENYMLWLSIRLTEMIKSAEHGEYVPQIWAAVVLFYRSKRRPLDKWPKLKACWLSIIQQCFNSGELAVRQHATLAWNKLVFATMPDATTSKHFMSILQVPISTILGKRGSDKITKQIKGPILDCYYNLLHYSLRPSLSSEEYDTAWDIQVEPILATMIKTGSKGRDEVCRILHGLLSPNAGTWNVNAALNTEPIKPEELPRLEPRWVRSRLAKLLSVVEPIVVADMRTREISYAPVDRVWALLMESTAHAGLQEVKTTSELKEAIALAVNMLRRIWQQPAISAGGSDSQSWVKQYTSLVAAMPEQLGPTPFVEEILARTDSNSVEVAPTPSNRPSKHHSAPTSPMVILLGQFCQPPKSMETSGAYWDCAETLIQRFVVSKPTLSAKLELLNRSIHSWTEDYQTDLETPPTNNLWLVVADVAAEVLRCGVEPVTGLDSQGLGLSLRNGVSILVRGLRMKSIPEVYCSLTGLHDALWDAAKRGAGDGGIVLAVVEPLAKVMLDDNVCTTMEMRVWLATQILRNPVWPKTRIAMEQGRKALWGVGLPPHKASLFDPFDNVYSLISDIMIRTYDLFDGSAESVLDASNEFVTAVINFLHEAPVSLLPTALRKVQDGFSMWVADTARKTSSDQTIATQVRFTWSSIIVLLRTTPSKDSNILRALEPLLVAGFASPHRTIVNETILFWNDTFGLQPSLTYPSKLEAVLRARSTDAEIELPAFPGSSEEKVPASLPDFFESQSQLDGTSARLQVIGGSRAATTTAQRSPRPSLRRSLLPARKSPPRRSISNASLSKRAQPSSGSSTPKARLRHNDSQVQFAPIDSSPLQPTDESQALTEHQKEVKARQMHNAHLFPEMSSSPIAHSTSLQKNVSKQLDFASRADQMNKEAYGTPTGIADANALASDDIPSSPTPSSTRAASQGPLGIEDEQDEDALPQDPPSSPPQAATDHDQHHILQENDNLDDEADDTTIIDVAELPKASTDVDEPARDDTAEVEEPATENMVSASEYPSDSQLPTAQLQIEAEEAAQRSAIDAAELFNETVNHAEPELRSSQRGSPTDASLEEDQSIDSKAHDVNVSRVENSFVERNGDNDSQATETSQSQLSQKSGKKRKRSSGSNWSSKKRKQQSPLKRIWSSFMGVTQQDDDDMEDEIVVASSQRSMSPVPSRIERTAVSQEQDTEETSQPISDAVKEELSVMQPPAKRGRGRPRKSQSQTSTPSLAEAETARSLKRRASTISNVSVESTQVSTSFVKDTPAPAKAATHRSGQHSKRGEVSQSSQPSQTSQISQGSGATTRGARAVEVRLSETSQALREYNGPPSEADDDQVAAIEEQLGIEQAAAESQERTILTPRSILGRLRNALSDLRGMIIGPQDEREFDDVLFELRRETHEAARRGKEDA